jgi:hypothetical protein
MALIWSPEDLRRVTSWEVKTSVYEATTLLDAAMYTASLIDTCKRQFQGDVWGHWKIRCDPADLIVSAVKDAVTLRTNLRVSWDPGPRAVEFIGGPAGSDAPGHVYYPKTSPCITINVAPRTVYKAPNTWVPSGPFLTTTYAYNFYGWNPDTRCWVYVYPRKHS